MKHLVMALSFLLVLLQAPAPALAGDLARKVLIVGVDGLRADALEVALSRD